MPPQQLLLITIRRAWPALLGLSVVASCVSTNAAVMDSSVKLAPTCADGVAMFTTADKVGRDYQEIAILNSKGESGWTSEKGMYESQKRKAASLGANAIIINNINEPKAGTKIIGSLLGTGAERKGSAVAIYIPSDSARTRTACAARKP